MSKLEFSLTRFGNDTQLKVIRNFMTHLDSKGARYIDEAIKISSNQRYLSQDQFITSFINDVTKYNIVDEDKAKSFLKAYCKIDLDDEDTGAITGKDAGNKYSRTAQTIVSDAPIKKWKLPSTSRIDTIKYFSKDKTDEDREVYYSTINNLDIMWNAYEDETVESTSIDREAKAFIIKGLNSSWIENSLNLIEESLGLTFAENDSVRGTTSTNKLWIHFINDGGESNSTLWITSYFDNSPGNSKTTDLHMYLNMYFLNTIDIKDSNGFIPNEGYIDRLIAHELTHAMMSANIDYYIELPEYIVEGSAELVHGIDDNRQGAMLALLQKFPADIKSLFTANELEGTLLNDDYTPQFVYAGGYIILRYLAEQGAIFFDHSGYSEEEQEIIDSTKDEEISPLSLIETFLIEVPTAFYETYTDCVKQINKIMTIKAGRYELVDKIGDYVKIKINLLSANVEADDVVVTNPSISRQAKSISITSNSTVSRTNKSVLGDIAINVGVDMAVGWISSKNSTLGAIAGVAAGLMGYGSGLANPSNTGSISGFTNPAAGAPPVTKKNSHLVGYFSDYFDSFILNLATGSIIEFAMPRSITDNISASFEAQNVRGRSAPMQSYSETGARQISFQIEIQADFCKEEFNVTIAKLKALAYPVYSSEVINPSCMIKLGNVINSKFIINSVGINYDEAAPMRDHMYTKASVSIEAVETPMEAKSATEIERDCNTFSSENKGFKSWFKNKVIGTAKDMLGLTELGF